MEQQLKTGSTTGTGASLNVDLGFTPRRVELWNPSTSTKMVWTDDLTDGYCFKENPVRRSVIGTATAYTSVLSTARLKKGVISSATVAAYAYPFNWQIAGVNYSKATATAFAITATASYPASRYGIIAFEIGVDGAIALRAGGATGYASSAAAIAALPAANPAHVVFGYVVVRSGTATLFKPGTTRLTATNSTFYNIQPINYQTSLGVTPIDPGDSSTITGGFTIGADEDLNRSGDTIYYTAWR
jgi:hypothetical protein